MDLSIYIMISIRFCKRKWQNQRKIFGILNPLLFFFPLFWYFSLGDFVCKKRSSGSLASRSQDFVMMAWSPKQKSSRPKWLIIGKLMIMHILFSYDQHHLLPRNPNFLLILIVLGVYWMFPYWWNGHGESSFFGLFINYICVYLINHMYFDKWYISNILEV